MSSISNVGSSQTAPVQTNSLDPVQEFGGAKADEAQEHKRVKRPCAESAEGACPSKITY